VPERLTLPSEQKEAHPPTGHIVLNVEPVTLEVGEDEEGHSIRSVQHTKTETEAFVNDEELGFEYFLWPCIPASWEEQRLCAKAEDEIQFSEDEVFSLQPGIDVRYLAFQEGVECDECGSAISRGWVQEDTAIICCAACTGTSLKRLRAIWARECELV